MAGGHLVLQHPVPLPFLLNPPNLEWLAPTSPGPFLVPSPLGGIHSYESAP